MKYCFEEIGVFPGVHAGADNRWVGIAGHERGCDVVLCSQESMQQRTAERSVVHVQERIVLVGK